MGMFILGILSLFQIVALPGLIALQLFRIKGTFWQGVVYTFGLSLLINYCAVFLLVTLNLYSRPLVFILFVAQTLWAVWLYRDDLRKPLFDILHELWSRCISALSGLFPPPEKDVAPSQRAAHYIYLVFTLTTLVLALNRLWWGWEMFLGNMGTVFDGWDAVYSWNRWSEVWFAGNFPLDSRFYPQLIPANWSLTYMFLGGSTIQMFAKSIMPLFVLGILLQLFDLGVSLRQPGFFVAIVIFRSLIVRFIGVEINNGYVDTAAAFFALLPFYTIFKAQTAKTEQERLKLWTVGFFFAAAASVTKQPGVLIIPVYLILFYILLLRPNRGNPMNPSARRQMLIQAAIAMLIPISWYGYKLFVIYQGIDESEVLLNAAYAAQAHGNVGFVLQITQAVQGFGRYLVLFPLILCTLPLLPPLVRWLFVLFILPFPVVWALMASYTTRNLAISLPILALASGLAVDALFRLILKIVERFQIRKWKLALLPTAALIVLPALAFAYPENRVRTDDMTARQEVFSPSLNRELQRLYSSNPDMLVLTNYPVGYVLGEEDNQILFWYTDAQEFERILQNEAVTHLLVPSTGVNPEILARIEQMVINEELTFLLQDQGSSVIPYRLYAIKH